MFGGIGTPPSLTPGPSQKKRTQQAKAAKEPRPPRTRPTARAAARRTKHMSLFSSSHPFCGTAAGAGGGGTLRPQRAPRARNNPRAPKEREPPTNDRPSAKERPAPAPTPPAPAAVEPLPKVGDFFFFLGDMRPHKTTNFLAARRAPEPAGKRAAEPGA